jgi:hypothetical protein
MKTAVTAQKMTAEFMVATTTKLLLSTVLSPAAIFDALKIFTPCFIKKRDVLIGAEFCMFIFSCLVS